MADDEKQGSGTLLGFVLGGVTAGLLTKAWIERKNDEAIKSRAEIEAPELVAAVLEVVDELLGKVSFRGDFKDERHIMNGLARYIERKTELMFEVEPATPFGVPDILLEGVVALELKRGLKKAGMDRCIGQAAGFSRRWFTIILVFDTPSSRVQQMEDLMADKGLDHIPVVHFCPMPTAP